MKRSRVIAATLAVALLGSLAGLSAQAESGYYKWKDSKGDQNHSDRPPPAGVEYEFVSTDTGLTRRVSAEESRTEAAANTAPTGVEQTAAAEPPKVEKIPAYCDQAKGNLESLNSKARIRLRDPDDGSIRYLTEAEKEEQRQKARDLIAVHCD